MPDLVLDSVVRGELSASPSRSSNVCVVLLADISGFTKLSEQLSSLGNDGLECLSDTLNDYFARMIDMIYAHGGDVMKFAGDALLAVWRSREDMSEVPETPTDMLTGPMPNASFVVANAQDNHAGEAAVKGDEEFSHPSPPAPVPTTSKIKRPELTPKVRLVC